MALCAAGAPWGADPGANAVAAPRSHQVSIEAMQFSPQTIRVASGDHVTWTNRDVFPHTATARDRSFDSGGIPTGGSWTLTATRKGSFDYTCTYHPTMKATLIVD